MTVDPAAVLALLSELYAANSHQAELIAAKDRRIAELEAQVAKLEASAD